MFRSHHFIVVLTLVWLAGLTPSTHAQQADQLKKVPPSESREKRLATMRLLDTMVQTDDFQEPRSLKWTLEYINDKWKLPIFVNKNGFAQVLRDADIYADEVKLPPIPRVLPMRTALEIVLSQVGKGKATYLIRTDFIEIIPEQHNQPALLLRRPVAASYQKRMLRDVLDDLADLTGVSINFDMRIGEKVNTLIIATFTNATLQDALVTVTESVELKFVVLNNSVLVTTAERARVIENENAERKLPEPKKARSKKR